MTMVVGQTTKGNTARFSSRFARLVVQAGILDVAHAAWRNRLTVLAYHRVADPQSQKFCGFDQNVSATSEMFSDQMDFLTQHFNVISEDVLLKWLYEGQPLPPFSALITFDDGYRDNLTFALPVLRAKQLPAILFVATDCIEAFRPFYWDVVAYCFKHTSLSQASLPILGPRCWGGSNRCHIAEEWVRAVKWLPTAARRDAVDQLTSTLGVAPTSEAFADLYLTWEEARVMSSQGVAIGAHTRTHPILTTISAKLAREEMEESKQIIEQKLQTPVSTFAYPNGLVSDYDIGHQTMLHDLGYKAAFSLLPGPSTLSEARSKPMDIRRICINSCDHPARFAAKVAGVARVMSRL